MENKFIEKTKQEQTEYIDYDIFSELLVKAERMNCQEIIEIHKYLIGKKDSSGIHQGEFGIYFIYRLLEHDYGCSITKETPEELHKFFNSKYFSDYIKQIIKNSNKGLHVGLVDAIYSKRNLSEFSEEEFYVLDKQLREDGFGNLAVVLAFKLDSPGAIDFLNIEIDPISIIKRIILTSGLNDRPEYYSGRGANYSDLNEKHLISIYNKLERLDQNKALSMVKMTLTMPTLGATEFISSLYDLVRNHYCLSKCNLSTKNISAGNTKGLQRIATVVASYLSTSFQMGDATNCIKEEFIRLLPDEVLNKITNYEYITKTRKRVK